MLKRKLIFIGFFSDLKIAKAYMICRDKYSEAYPKRSQLVEQKISRTKNESFATPKPKILGGFTILIISDNEFLIYIPISSLEVEQIGDQQFGCF